MSEIRKPILDVLNGRKPSRVPFWLMRQAGRYLPEYRQLRSEAGSFLNLVYNPKLAAEVTVQPLRRFGMDGAILFSDILIVPHALGQSLAFETGEGPRLDPVTSDENLSKLDISKVEAHTSPIFETVQTVRSQLSSEGFHETTLIGFCGSPWTVACYMVEGKGSKDFASVRKIANDNPAFFQKLIDIVVEASCVYLSGQIRAGAEVIQLFDSWSGLLNEQEFQRWVIEPTIKIAAYLKKNHAGIPVIGFPRGAGKLAMTYVEQTGVNCVGLDQMADLEWAAKNLQEIVPLQGSLDPESLLAGGAKMEEDMKIIRDRIGAAPMIFNLGHGVIKETPIEHIEALRDIVRGWNL